MYLYCISVFMVTCLYFFIATHSTTTKLFLPLYIFHHLIRLSSSLQWSQHGQSWSTRATLGTTTVTPRPSAFRWRARPSSASVPLDTEEMAATVTVQCLTRLHTVCITVCSYASLWDSEYKQMFHVASLALLMLLPLAHLQKHRPG